MGERFDAVVLAQADGKRPAQIFIEEPAVLASCDGTLEQGTRLPVTLTAADPVERKVSFAPAPRVG